MNLGVIQGGVEHAALSLGSTFYGNTVQRLGPSIASLLARTVEGKLGLFGVQILAGISYRHKRYTHLHLNLFAFGTIVVKIVAHIIASQLLAVGGVELIFAVVGIPIFLRSVHRRLLFPVASRCGLLVDAHHEVDGEHRLRVVTEGAHQTITFNLCIAYTAHHTAHLVCQAVAQIQKDMAFTLREGVALCSATKGRCYLTTDAIFLQTNSIITWCSLFVAVFRAIVMVIHFEFTRRRHGKQGSKFWTAHTTQRNMGKTSEILIVILIRCRPPALVLIVHVQVATHDVERYYTHHRIGEYGSRITDAIVGGADKGIDVIYRRLSA